MCVCGIDNNSCIPNLFLEKVVVGGDDMEEVEGTGGDGTGLAETGGQASSQQFMPPTVPHHHLLLMYKRNTRTSAPKPATRPNRVLPSVPIRQIKQHSVPKKQNIKCSTKLTIKPAKLDSCNSLFTYKRWEIKSAFDLIVQKRN